MSVNLISNSTFNQLYPPGTSLGGAFNVEPDAGIFENLYFNSPLDQISPENPLVDSVTFTIKPTSLITDTTSQHRFTLTVGLDNGQSFSTDTVVTLTP